jgi:hypothetical protein
MKRLIFRQVVALGRGDMQQTAQELVSRMLQYHSPIVLTLPLRTSTCLGPLKQHLGGRRFHSNEEGQMAVCEGLGMQEEMCNSTNF